MRENRKQYFIGKNKSAFGFGGYTREYIIYFVCVRNLYEPIFKFIKLLIANPLKLCQVTAFKNIIMLSQPPPPPH